MKCKSWPNPGQNRRQTPHTFQVIIQVVQKEQMAGRDYQDGRTRRTAALRPEVFEQVRRIARIEGRSVAYQMGQFNADGVAAWVERNGEPSALPSARKTQ